MSTPEVSAGFEWRQTAAGRALVSVALSKTADHLFSSRDVSPAGARQPDYRAVTRAFGGEGTELIHATQVHGRGVLLIREGDTLDPRSEADAIISTDPRQMPAVRVADCVPILIADRRHRVVAAVHAGWRGTAAGVLVATVERLRAMGVQPDDLVVAIGPSIGPCCYQVDDTVYGQFGTRGWTAGPWFAPDGPGRWRLNLRWANIAQLEACGVPLADIHTADVCTAHAPDAFYSHRRQGDAAGRMIAAIRLRQ